VARSQVPEEEGPLQIRVGFDADAGRLKEALAAKVADVSAASRLTDSLACIVASESDPGPFMTQRLSGSSLPAQPVPEINPHHP